MDPPRETEEELESFRKQWKEEVTARSRQGQHAGPSRQTAESSKAGRRKTTGPMIKSAAGRRDMLEGADEIEPRAYHDLPDKEAELQLGAAEQGLGRGFSTKEPKTALEHYEKAVEKETQGSLGDSLRLYQKAFKLDDRVHETYKNKHFPPSSFPPKPPQSKSGQPDPSNASQTVPGTAHHSLHGLPQTIAQLIEEFSLLSIPGLDPPTDLSPAPPCPIADLPEEILANILHFAALDDVSTLSPISRVCKRFAYLVMTEERMWKSIALSREYGFTGMHYEYACDLSGKPLANVGDDERTLGMDNLDDCDGSDLTTRESSLSTITNYLFEKQYGSSWRQMFRSRPRLRFNGCYISTVNYTRPGAASTTQVTWHTPVHIVTYFRYLRFFRDGTVISLLTTGEPVDVVHHLTKENMHNQHGSLLPSAVMKDALAGRWRLSGPGDGVASEEAEGDVHIETEGVVPKYMWVMQFSLGSAGRGTRNNKLSWKGFWSYNKLADDWGEFGLRNDKAYYWSRVKSYGSGM